MSVATFFDDMSYGPAPEADTEARAWLARHEGKFGHFINGASVGSVSGKTFDTFEPATGKLLAKIAHGGRDDVNAAVAAARKAQGPWAKLSGHARARHLYALARMSKVYIGGDTGPTHLAVAARTPIVGLFGPTEWWRNGSPRAEDVCVERTDIDCRVDCHRRSCSKWICMDIEVERVFRAVEKRLALT